MTTTTAATRTSRRLMQVGSPQIDPPRIIPISELPDLGDVELVPVTKCNLCGSSHREVALTATDWTARYENRPPFQVAICRDCGLIYLTKTLPRPILEFPGKHGGSLLYGMPADDYACARFFEKQYAKGIRAAEWVSQQIGGLQGKRVLDVLSGVGGIVKGFADQGAVAEGLEPSAVLGAFAREKHGLTMHRELLDTFCPTDKYDVITGLQMLNHFADPTAVLHQLKPLLKPGGLLFTETLDFVHAISRKPISACVHVDHPHMFTVGTLRAFFQKTGYEVVALEADADRKFDFTSMNHIHALCRVDSNPSRFEPQPTAFVDAQLAYLNGLAEFFSRTLNPTKGRPSHFAQKPNLLKRLVRSLRHTMRGLV